MTNKIILFSAFTFIAIVLTGTLWGWISDLNPTGPKSEPIVEKIPTISEKDALNIVSNNSTVLERIGNNSFEIEEACKANLNNIDVYLVNVRLYNNSEHVGTLNVFITFDGKIETIAWSHPPILPPDNPYSEK